MYSSIEVVTPLQKTIFGAIGGENLEFLALLG